MNTKVPRSTKKMVEGVRRRHDKVRAQTTVLHVSISVHVSISLPHVWSLLVSLFLQFPDVIGPVLDSVEALVERAQKELEHLADGTTSSYATLEVQ